MHLPRQPEVLRNQLLNCITKRAIPHGMALRLSKKSVIVKIDIHNSTGFYSLDFIYKSGYSKLYRLKTSLLRKDFDLLRNSRPTVPMYADGRELLVLRTFSQSGSVPKRVFRHAERAGIFRLLFFIQTTDIMTKKEGTA